jgi:hypothetical protein
MSREEEIVSRVPQSRSWKEYEGSFRSIPSTPIFYRTSRNDHRTDQVLPRAARIIGQDELGAPSEAWRMGATTRLRRHESADQSATSCHMTTRHTRTGEAGVSSRRYG